MLDNHEAEKGDRRSLSRVHFQWTITFGQMIQIAIITAGIFTWAMTAANKAESALAAIADLKADLTLQIAALRASMDQANGSLGQAIAGLDARLRTVENATASNTARLDNIERASNIPLPTRRR